MDVEGVVKNLELLENEIAVNVLHKFVRLDLNRESEG